MSISVHVSVMLEPCKHTKAQMYSGNRKVPDDGTQIYPNRNVRVLFCFRKFLRVSIPFNVHTSHLKRRQDYKTQPFLFPL